MTGQLLPRARWRAGLSRAAATLAILLAALALALILGPEPAQAQAPEPHRYIQEYVGPATCETCHPGEVDEVLHSVHYSWEGKLDHYNPIPATTARINWLGMLNVELNIPGGCARCHVGAGALPKPAAEATVEDRAQIDCLICHSPNYDTSLRFPVQTEAGEWRLTQDRSLLAARNAQRPTAENCLQCHFNVGGGPLLKRGVDFAPIADKHGESSKGDVHAQAGMVCVDCHQTTDHQVRGYGPSLWSRDRPQERLFCEECHGDAPHQEGLINRHTRLDCRTCHVVGAGGLVSRDWTAAPEYDSITELYWPVSDTREANSVAPEYRWFNGQPAIPDQPWPGDRTDENSRLQPFKRYDAVVPVDSASDEPIPLKLDVYFTRGDLEQAIAVGAEDAGLNYRGSWRPREVSTLLQISHGIAGKEEALYCQDCHVPDGRMDFAALGYVEDEVALLTSLSSTEAGERRPLRMEVIVPQALPLETPVSLSGNVQATRGRGLRLSWSPLLALAAVLAIVAAVGAWLWSQRPQAG